MTFRIILSAALACVSQAAEPPNFQDHVLPVFKKHCNNCHNPDKKKADLDLTSVAGIQKGSSGGEVVRVGTPDSSPLFMAMNHDEDFDPMPPKKPKLDEKTLTIVRDWIAGGMVPHAGGESGLRDVSYDVAAGSATKPDEVAIPSGLSKPTQKPAPVLTVATSPWADVFAVAGHREVRMYAPSPAAAVSKDFKPVGAEDLAVHLSFDDSKDEGILGGGLLAKGEPVPVEMKSSIDPSKGFTFSVWLKSSANLKGSPYLFGNDRFKFFLEASRDDWKLRINVRDQDNRSLFFGRVGTFQGKTWSHVAMTFNGSEFVTYFGGSEVARQPVDEIFKSFRISDHPMTLGGIEKHVGFSGGMDDFRFYSRALTHDEVRRVAASQVPQLGLVGAMPFELGSIHQLRFSPNGSLLAAAGGKGAHSGAVNLYEVKSGKLQATVGNEQDVVLAADIRSDHKLVALGGPSRVVKIHNTKDGKLLHRIEKHTDWVTAVRFSPDGKLLATGDRNGAVYVWEAENGGIVYSLTEHKAGITDLAWRPDSGVLATTGEDGKLVLWSMDDGFPLRAVKAHEKKSSDRYTRLTGALDVAYLPDGGLFTSGRDRSLRLWKTDGAKDKALPELPELPLAAAVTHDGSRALTGHRDGRVLLWDLVSGSSTELPR